MLLRIASSMVLRPGPAIPSWEDRISSSLDVVAGLAGHLYAASQLAGPLPYPRSPRRFLSPTMRQTDPVQNPSSSRILPARSSHCTMTRLHAGGLASGSGIQCMGRIIAATPPAARAVFQRHRAALQPRSRGLRCEWSCPGALATLAEPRASTVSGPHSPPWKWRGDACPNRSPLFGLYQSNYSGKASCGTKFSVAGPSKGVSS
jgi:hypothetical protein